NTVSDSSSPCRHSLRRSSARHCRPSSEPTTSASGAGSGLRRTSPCLAGSPPSLSPKPQTQSHPSSPSSTPPSPPSPISSAPTPSPSPLVPSPSSPSPAPSSASPSVSHSPTPSSSTPPSLAPTPSPPTSSSNPSYAFPTPFSVLSFFCHHSHPIGIRPSPCTFPRIITAAKLSAAFPLGESLHSLALKLGFLSYIPISNSFIHFYVSADALDLAQQLFDEMPDRDPVSYNSLIDGYVKNRDLDEAEKLFWSTTDWSVVTWSCLFNGFVRNRMFRRGMDFYSKMRIHSVELDDTTVVTLLMLYAHYKYALFGKSVHGYLLRRWSHLPTHVSSTLIDLYCNCSLLDAAAALFYRMEKKDLICWNTFIAGLGSQGRGKVALDVFEQMLLIGMKPDDVTFIGVLVACAHSGLVEEGVRYFEMMSSRFGIKPSFAHHWCLVDLYVRIGRPLDAMRIIQGMPLDSLSSVWGAVISLARIHGDISVGEYLGKKLIDLEPDNYRRYVPLANLYVAASQWDKYRELMQIMKSVMKASRKLQTFMRY
ncbi:pentatricopeptide repeat-containing protein At1g05750, chloroplastic-like, partial [Dioscorea cayenensis subsp. rotundata]|uniref:Pentatricopeptide repeat-containing protein At1g05750, chloroplastic-like n=1 Tax=Dioscorea cayennensis subsp. rotundata TaxID=55577 RepID=A0AB40CFH1_DIOCR